MTTARTAILALFALSFTSLASLATPGSAVAEEEDQQCIADADGMNCVGKPKTHESLMQSKMRTAQTVVEPLPPNTASEDAEMFDDLESAKKTLEERVTKKHASADGVAFLQFLEKAVNQAVGPRGEVVVGLLEERDPCAGGTYLHETFVHSDQKSASFVCQPCHSSCAGHCYGANRDDCHLLAAEEGGARSGLGAAFVQTFREDLLKRMEAFDFVMAVNGSESTEEPLDDEAVKKALAEGKGTVEVSEFQEEQGTVNYTNAHSEIVKVVAPGDVEETSVADMDMSTLRMQTAINQALKDNGFIPGMVEPPTDEGLAAYVDQEVDETGEHFGKSPRNEAEEDPADDDRAKTSLSQQEASSATGRKPVSNLAKTKLKGIAKDHSKKAASYVKTEIKAWIDAQEGDCLDSVALVTEASQNLYECFKSNYAQLKSAFCDPPPRHKQIKDALTGISSASKNINYVAKLLKNVPQIRSVCTTVERVTEQVNTRMKTTLNKLEAQNKQDKGKTANMDCCPPFPASGCASHPGAKYKCGACSSGAICNSQAACNTLNKLEQKFDKFKADYYDPLVEKVAEAAQNVQAGNNLVSGDSVLAACGFRNCADLKKAAAKIKAEMDATFHDKVCPLKVSGISVPTLGPINVVANIFSKIGGFLQNLRNILGKVHCVNYPRVEFYTTYECTQVCLPCCSYHGRRRWVGRVSCRSCCHNVCVHVPRTRAWMERFCFSAQDILDFVSGLMSIIFKPIMAVINAALKPVLDLIMAPINALFNQLFGHLTIDFPSFPSMPLLDFSLPSLPNFKLGIPSYSVNHPTCSWIRSKAGI